MKRKLLVCLALATLIAGCTRSSTDEPDTETRQAIAVETRPVTSGSIADVLSATGETAATGVARLSSPIAGRVTLLRVQAGDEVARGQVLARVLSFENEAAVNGFALLRGATSKSAGAAADAALEREVAAKAIGIASPFAGIVVERVHNAGEQVAPGDALLELFDPTSLMVVAQVPAEAAARIAKGMAVDVAGAGFRASGRVDAVLPALAPGALTVPVRVAFDDKAPTRLLHTAVQCRVTLAEHEQALLIPPTALLAAPNGTSGDVFVVDGGKARRAKITIGLRTADAIEVTSGLNAGDPVIVEGGYGLPDDTAVVAREPEPPAP